MQYVEIKDNIIINHCCSSKIPLGQQFKQVTSFNAYVGIACDALDFNNGGCLKALPELIELGIIKDNRGVYYDTETKDAYEIKNYNQEPKQNWTKEKPSFDYEKWDGQKWITDTVEKQKYDDNIKIIDARIYLNTTDYRVIKAMEKGVGLDDLYPGESVKREEARVILRDFGLSEQG